MEEMNLKKDNRSPGIYTLPMLPGDQQNTRSKLAQCGASAKLNDIATPLENSLFGSASCLYEFFHSNGYMILRQEWEAKTIPSPICCYVGWIYAFYDKDDLPIYVGETSRTFMERFDEHIKKQSWWPCWSRVKVMPCPNQTMRKVFESLIGLAGGYGANKLQPAGGDNILDDVILSLLALGNEGNTLPIFPNEMIFNQTELLRANLEVIGVKNK